MIVRSRARRGTTALSALRSSIVLVLGAGGVAACVAIAAASATRSAGVAGGAASSVAAGTGSTALLARLSDQQLAGQRIVYSYAGSKPPASLLGKIRRGEAAGVIFFAPNVPSRSALRAAVGALAAADRASPVHAPLLLMTDQEGGRVRRLPGPPLLSAKQIGESSNPIAAARTAGREAALNLASAGLNVNLAPVLDVYRESGDFIDQYERSFGRDPHRVAELGAAFIAAQQAEGLAATAKHFPGLGAATQAQNTDERPVRLNLTASELRTVDELPYRAAVAAGVRLVMLSWAVYPALDATLPAGLSAKIIREELRGRLHFGGITITDSLGAGALTGFGGPAKRALLAARAGEDLILCSARRPAEDTPAVGEEAQSSIAQAIAARELPRSEAESVAAAVISFRKSL